MLPGNGIGDTDKTCYPSSPEYKFKYGSEGLNTTDIKEYIKNPHKFNIKRVMDGQYYNLWSTDNDKIGNNDDVVIKSVYDPSPVGYSLPASNAFTGFTTTGWNVDNRPNPLTPEQRAKFNAKGNWDNGWYFYTKPNKQGLIFWFPAVGDRFYGTGINRLIYLYGHYWLAGTPTTWDGFCLILNESHLYINFPHLRSHGFSVRSAEEKKLKYELDEIAKGVWVKMRRL